MDGLLNALKFAHIMSADIIKSACSSGEIVRKMWKLQFCRFLQTFVSRGGPVYVLVADSFSIGR